jgi:hypothetical protein
VQLGAHLSSASSIAKLIDVGIVRPLDKAAPLSNYGRNQNLSRFHNVLVECV